MRQRFDRDRTFAIFENPQNGYREAIPESAWIWTFLFGAFYLAYRQVWLHVAIIVAVLFVFAALVAPLIPFVVLIANIAYARNAKQILMTNYYRRGWRDVEIEDANTFERSI